MYFTHLIHLVVNGLFSDLLLIFVEPENSHSLSGIRIKHSWYSGNDFLVGPPRL